VHLTQAGSVMGTATYFSPEQAQGHAVDPRSDVYSLGCVLYEMLTTRPPFSGDTPVAIAYKHVQEAVTPPTRINPNVPADLEAIDLKALEKTPAGRYASAEDLRADLRRFLEGKPVGARSGAAAAAPGAAAGLAAGATMADATAAVPATGVGGPVVTAAPTGAMGPVTPGQGSPAYVPPDDKPKRTGLYVGVLIVLLALLGAGLFFIGSRLDQPVQQKAVPDVVGLQVADAIVRLQDEGFRVETREEQSDRPVGEVFAQAPAGNVNADEGATVTLRVSAGVGEVAVPDVVGRTRPAAESLLRNAGFVADVREQPDSNVPAGQVISQNPAAAAMAEKGSVVELVVSSGPPQVAIPDLTNQTQSAASNTLGQLGLRVTTRQEPSTSIGAGNVIGTEPPAGAQVAEGGTVTLIVSTGPPPTTTTTTTTTSTTTTTTTPTSTTSTVGGGGPGT
jgi:eukaryotic-like serine/threonine-protein kinase